MLDAYELYPVRQGQRVRFYDPPGIEMASVDPTTMFLATPYCTETEERAFISGTTPTGFCPIHSLPGSSLFSRAVRGIGRALGSIF
jgi:hypothetical protein